MRISAKRLTTLLAITLLIQATPAPAEVIPGKWQKVDQLLAGSHIILKTNAGEILDCLYFSSTDEILLVVESVSKQQRRIPKTSVQKVTATEYDDSLKNGAILGLAIGAGLGVALTSITDVARHKNSIGDRVLGSALFALLGVGFGAMVDYKHRGSEVIYEAPKKADR